MNGVTAWLIHLNSPLDQFGGDLLFLLLWQSLYCWFIEAIDLADLIDLVDMDIPLRIWR